jgi:hypothetical protein
MRTATDAEVAEAARAHLEAAHELRTRKFVEALSISELADLVAPRWRAAKYERLAREWARSG